MVSLFNWRTFHLVFWLIKQELRKGMLMEQEILSSERFLLIHLILSKRWTSWWNMISNQFDLVFNCSFRWESCRQIWWEISLYPCFSLSAILCQAQLWHEEPLSIQILFQLSKYYTNLYNLVFSKPLKKQDYTDAMERLLLCYFDVIY